MKTFPRLLLALGAAALLASPGSAAYLPTPLGAGNVTFAPPGGGAAVDLQSRGQTQLYVSDKGARGSTLTTTGHFNTIGNNAFTLIGAIDLRVGDDIWVANESATSGPSSPTSGAATPCGTPRSPTIAHGYWRDACTPGAVTCDYYAVEDDGHGGWSAPIDMHATNVFGDDNYVGGTYPTTIWHDVYLSMTPSVNGHTAPIWKNCGAGDHYILAAQPSTVFTIAAPGTGYTVASPCTTTIDSSNGTCAWTATGGGCSQEPRGWLAIFNGAISAGGIDRDKKGVGCTGTSPPTINLATVSGLSSGSGGSLTLAFKMEAEDAGYIPTWVPAPYSATAHPTGAGSDALVATIGALNGSVATLCVAGTGVNGVTCTPISAPDTTTRIVNHSWTRNFAAAIAAAPTAGPNGAVISVLNITCGDYDYEEPLIFGASNLTIKGDSGWQVPNGTAGCVTLHPKGNTWAFLNSGGYDGDGLQNLVLDGRNTTGGGYFAAYRGASRNQLVNIYDQYFASAFAYIGAAGTDIVNVTGNHAWGYGGATFSIGSTYANQACCYRLSNIYHNDGTNGDFSLNALGGLMHDGYEFDNVATIDQTLQCAYSAAWGLAYNIHDDTGHGYQINIDTASGNEFLNLHCAGEFARAGGMYVFDCKAHCYNDPAGGGINGPILGWSLYVGPQAEFVWSRGHLSGAGLGGAYVDGFVTITNSTLSENSDPTKSPPGMWAALTIGPHANNVQFSNNRTTEPTAFNNPNITQLAPVQMASVPGSPGTYTSGSVLIANNTFWGNVNNRVIGDQVDLATVSTTTAGAAFGNDTQITLSGACPANVSVGQSIKDTDISGSPIIASVSKCIGSPGVVTVQRKMDLASAGSADHLTFFNFLPPPRSDSLIIACNPGTNATSNSGGTNLNDCKGQIGGFSTPRIIPSSGTMGNNGAATFTTALDATYAHAYFLMPAVSIYADATFSGQISGAGGAGSGNFLSVLSGLSGTIQILDGLLGAGIVNGGTFISGSTDLSNCVGGAVACYTIGNLNAAIGPETMSTGNPLGLYPGVMSNTTHATLYNNPVFINNGTGGLGPWPSSLTTFATTGPGAYTQITTGNSNIFAMVVPGYQIGPNDGLKVEVSATFPANTNSKAFGCAYNGYSFGSATFSSNTQSRWAGELGFANDGSTAIQWPTFNGNGLSNGGLGTTNAGLTAGAVAAWQDQNLYCHTNLTVDTDWMVLRNLEVLMRPGTN